MSRVKVFTIDGAQIGVPDVGEKNTPNILTFPRCFGVGDALRCRPWIRFATDEELAATPSGFVPQWWRELDFQFPAWFPYSPEWLRRTPRRSDWIGWQHTHGCMPEQYTGTGRREGVC